MVPKVDGKAKADTPFSQGVPAFDGSSDLKPTVI